VNALKPFLKRGWSMIDTSASPDPDSGFLSDHRIKPDISVYSDGKPSNNNLCRSCDMETFLELKLNTNSDGFCLDKGPDGVFVEKEGGIARDTRGQLVTYLNAMQASQFRTHGFGVLILGKKCRLLRHTHSAIEVSTRFDYTSSNTSHLQTFFWRLSHACPAVRGVDETFEAQSTVSHEIRTLLNAHTHPVWKVRVGNRFFYVSKSFTRNHHYPVGRGTRCFVAVDCKTFQKCVLKDVWRVVGYHPEGEVYARLHKDKVGNIPGIIAEGDVDSNGEAGGSHSCGFFDSGWSVPNDSTIREHKHYRIVLNVVGEPISEFRSTWELTKCILDAVKAHRDAVKAGVEHRDISPGNIIIVRSNDETAAGYLIDWELSKYQEEEGIRAYERTGTIQFMAARLFSDQPIARTVGDDLESFMLVFLWLAALYAPNKMSEKDRGEVLQVYDSPNRRNRANFLLVGHATPRQFELKSTYLSNVLMELMHVYSARYAVPFNDTEASGISEKMKQLETHLWMIETMQKALKNDEWNATKDHALRQEFVLPVVKENVKKRKSACTEYDYVFCARKRQRGEKPAGSDNDLDSGSGV
ncbi:hypothetical protein BT96DRAFT_840232, partial [Gymnopus androsaceus JB14]